MFAEALISKEERNKRLAKVEEEVEEYNVSIASYKQRIVFIDSMLNDTDNSNGFFENYNIFFDDISSATEKQMSDLVHRYITDVRLERFTMPTVTSHYEDELTNKLCGKKCIKVTVTTYDNRKVFIYYFSKFTTIPNSWWCCESDEDVSENSYIEPFPFEPLYRKNGRCFTDSIELRKEIASKYSEWWNSETKDRLRKRECIMFERDIETDDFLGMQAVELRNLMMKLQKMVRRIDLNIYPQTFNYLAMKFEATEADDEEYRRNYESYNIG